MRAQRRSGRVVTGILAGLAIAATFGSLTGFLAVTRAARRQSTEQADALVVLGAKAFPDRPSAELRARLEHATNLFRAGRAPVVVCCGGSSEETAEVEVMASYLVEAGVPPQRIVCVDGATTRVSMASVARHAFDSILIVTSPYHVHRALAEARRHGVVAQGCPAPASPEHANPPIRLLRTSTEVAAAAWYALPTSLTARVPTGPTTIRHRIPRALARRTQRRRTDQAVGTPAAQRDAGGPATTSSE